MPEKGLVSEPAETLFALQDNQQALELVRAAFAYARAEAALIESLKPAQVSSGAPQRRSELRNRVKEAEAKIAGIRAELAKAGRDQRDKIRGQLAAAQGELALAKGRVELFDTMGQFEAGGGAGGLSAQIDELERSVPELGAGQQNAAAVQQQWGLAARQAESQPSGSLALARRWWSLRSKVASLDHRSAETAQLNELILQTGATLRAGLARIDSRASALAAEASSGEGASAENIEKRKKEFQALIDRRKAVGAALLPLGRTSALLLDYRKTLSQWTAVVHQQSVAALRSLISSIVGLVVILGLVLLAGAIWRRLAFRYVEGARLRAQMLQLRNFVIGLLIVMVLAFEAIREVESLATIIGLATAGIALALQDPILSVAGYFRINGRFGLRVGDWVEVQGVRGEVVDISLTKLTLLELGGSQSDRAPTGRLAVLSNSVVFKDKYLNRAYGVSLGWDEIEFTVAPECDYRMAEKRLLEAVDQVFARYDESLRRQSREMEARFSLTLDTPRPTSRVRVRPDGIHITVRYPVDARIQSRVADEVSRRLLDRFHAEPGLRLVPSGPVNIQASPPSDGQQREGQRPARGDSSSST